MGWTKRSYDALHNWPDAAQRPAIRRILIADGLGEIVARLEAATTMGEWYKISCEAAGSVGPRVVARSAREAEQQLAVRRS